METFKDLAITGREKKFFLNFSSTRIVVILSIIIIMIVMMMMPVKLRILYLIP